MQSVQSSSISQKHLTLFLTSPYSTSLSLLNLPPLLLSWLHSYLQDRTQEVIINGSLSFKFQVISGVPQCSILGPLLFMTLLNYHSSFLATLTLYADDILLSQEISFPILMSTVQSNINFITFFGLALVMSPSTPKKPKT